MTAAHLWSQNTTFPVIPNSIQPNLAYKYPKAPKEPKISISRAMLPSPDLRVCRRSDFGTKFAPNSTPKLISLPYLVLSAPFRDFYCLWCLKEFSKRSDDQLSPRIQRNRVVKCTNSCGNDNKADRWVIEGSGDIFHENRPIQRHLLVANGIKILQSSGESERWDRNHSIIGLKWPTSCGNDRIDDFPLWRDFVFPRGFDRPTNGSTSSSSVWRT